MHLILVDLFLCGIQLRSLSLSPCRLPTQACGLRRQPLPNLLLSTQEPQRAHPRLLQNALGDRLKANTAYVGEVRRRQDDSKAGLDDSFNTIEEQATDAALLAKLRAVVRGTVPL
jgi:hypothetical protein